jgi:mannose-6-phosphate isomerase-like protein (cupin superfamily)
MNAAVCIPRIRDLSELLTLSVQKLNAMPHLLTVFFLFFLFCAKAQDVFSLAELEYEGDLPVKVEPVATDSLASSYIIWIASEVKAHLHAAHTEYVVILEGAGTMLLGNQNLTVQKGDLVYIPNNTAHAVEVTSKERMKVLSIQCPEFKGKDRIWLPPPPKPKRKD